jgi:hypothetical protein
MSYIQYVNFNDQRFKSYEQNEQLYKGDHWAAFSIRDYEYYHSPQDYITYNFPQVLSNSIVDLMWSENPTISFEQGDNQKFIDTFIDKESLYILLRRLSITASYSGDAVCVVNVMEVNGKAEIKCSQVSNKMWFPIFNPLNPETKATGHILVYSKVIDKDTNATALLLEAHTAGSVEYESYIKDSGTDKWMQVSVDTYFNDETAELSVDIIQSGLTLKLSTKCSEPLVFHLANYKMQGDFFGQSDYTTATKSKVFAVNQNLNQMQYVLTQHAHPLMIVPKGLISQAVEEVQSSMGNIGENDLLARQAPKTAIRAEVAAQIIRKAEILGVSATDTIKPEYITWNGNLNESREQVNLLKNALFEESQLAKILIDPTIATGSLSGIAIMRLAQPSLHKAKLKQAYLTDMLKRLFYTILQLAQNMKVESKVAISPEYPSISFKDGLVNDMKEVIEEQQLLLDNSLTTKIDAIMETQDLSEEQAQKKMNRIHDEQNLFVPPPATPSVLDDKQP